MAFAVLPRALLPGLFWGLASAAGEPSAGGCAAPTFEAVEIDQHLSLMQKRAQLQRASEKRFAYVTLAFDPPDRKRGTTSPLWPVLPLARTLQRQQSKYPLLVLTDSATFPDGAGLADALAGLNAIVVPAREVPMPPGLAEDVKAVDASDVRHGVKVSWLKLQAWRLTAYEKLLWLDADALIVRSLDWLFEEPGMWAQNLHCPDSGRSEFCGGFLTLEPSEATYEGLIRHAFKLDVERPGWLSWGGDQPLIGDYFESNHVPIQMVSADTATWGWCVADLPKINDIHSVLPAFVHKASKENECFGVNTKKQMTKLSRGTEGKRKANQCQYDPLGVLWRETFCDAVRHAGVDRESEVAPFCDDARYFEASA